MFVVIHFVWVAVLTSFDFLQSSLKLLINHVINRIEDFAFVDHRGEYHQSEPLN